MRRLVELFVAPSDAVSAVGATTRSPLAAAMGGERAARDVGAIVVLGADRACEATARLVAGELRQRAKAECVLLGAWSPVSPLPESESLAPAGESVGPAARGHGGRAAKALAARLNGHGHVAEARGRLVSVALPADAVAAEHAWAQATQIAAVPAVCALAGPRPPALDALLVDASLIVAVVSPGAPAALEQAMRAELAYLPAHVAVVAPFPRLGGRIAASSAVAAPRLLGAELVDAIGRVAA